MSINLFLWGFLLSQIYKSYYPEEYNNFKNKFNDNFNPIIEKMNNFTINIFYNLLYIYSIIQIKAIKIKQIVTPYYEIVNDILIENSIIRYDNVKSIVSFYYNGDLLKLIEYSFPCNQIFASNLVKPEKCDLITIEEVSSKDGSQFNVTCLHNISENINVSNSNIKFLSLECNYNNTDFNIELRTSKYNFYMNDTIIDAHFIKYYLKNILNVNYYINDDNFTYTLNLIDHNVNCVQLSEADAIIIKKDDYIINKKDTNPELVNHVEEVSEIIELNEKHKRTLSDEKDWVISEKTSD